MSLFKLLPRTAIRSLSLASLFSGMSSPTSTPMSIRSYTPSNPDGPFPYSRVDLTPMDAGNDDQFYAPSRFVAHIDDNAIINLRRYYDENLPRKGSILDFCSSWISHYPPEVERAAKDGDLVVLGTGMNAAELKGNPVLTKWSVQDLNDANAGGGEVEVTLPREQGVTLDASTCVVSIDYLTRPVAVLESIRRQTREGGKVHLAISNRCFPTKAVGRWLRIREQERLEMVGDYLWWAGWREVEIVDVVKGGFMTDPLWVVRGTNVAAAQSGKSEL